MNDYNVELMRRHFQYEERGDSDAVLAEMTDTPEYYIPGRSEEIVRSKAGIRDIHQSLIEGLPDLKIEVESLFATDSHGCAEVIVSGTQSQEFQGIPPTGKRIAYKVASVFTFKDGKIASESVYYDRRVILRQLGITEELVFDVTSVSG